MNISKDKSEKSKIKNEISYFTSALIFISPLFLKCNVIFPVSPIGKFLFSPINITDNYPVET